MILFTQGLPCVQCTKNRLPCENYIANYKIFQERQLNSSRFPAFPGVVDRLNSASGSRVSVIDITDRQTDRSADPVSLLEASRSRLRVSVTCSRLIPVFWLMSTTHHHPHHRHRTDKHPDTRRPVATAADRVAANHCQKLQSQDGRLPELLLAYSCLTNHSEAASLWLVTPKQDVGDRQWCVVCCNIEYRNFGMQNMSASNVKVIF